MPVSAVTQNGSSTPGASKSDRAILDQEEFFNLLLSQYQNQDPTAPSDTSQIMQQMAQLQTLQSTAALTEGINQLREFQTMVTAGSFVGKTVEGISNETGETLVGKVRAAYFENGKVSLQVGPHTVDIGNVLGVVDEGLIGLGDDGGGQ